MKSKTELLDGEVKQLEQTCAGNQREISRLKEDVETTLQALMSIKEHS
jgi:hypothetical protein